MEIDGSQDYSSTYHHDFIFLFDANKRNDKKLKNNYLKNVFFFYYLLVF